MATFVPIAENIWIVDGDNVNFHGFPYPTRSVVVRFKNGGLWIWSPIELSDRLRSEIQSIGQPAHFPTRYIIFFLATGMRHFPTRSFGGLHLRYESAATSSFNRHSSMSHRPHGLGKSTSAGSAGPS